MATKDSGVPPTLYHGASRKNRASIRDKGLWAAGILPKGALPETEFVYLTDDLEVAKRYGEDVWEVDTSKLDRSKMGTYREMLCDVLNTSDFWHHQGDIPAGALALAAEGAAA